MSSTYSQEDVQQILNIAIARDTDKEEFSRTQLLEIAAELGISTATLQAAEQEWQLQKNMLTKRQDFELYRKQKLRKHIARYAIVNTFLVSLNALMGFGFAWSLYVLLFWGLGLALNVWNVYYLKGEEYDRAFRNWYHRHQFRRVVDGFLGRLWRAFST